MISANEMKTKKQNRNEIIKTLIKSLILLIPIVCYITLYIVMKDTQIYNGKELVDLFLFLFYILAFVAFIMASIINFALFFALRLTKYNKILSIIFIIFYSLSTAYIVFALVDMLRELINSYLNPSASSEYIGELYYKIIPVFTTIIIFMLGSFIYFICDIIIKRSKIKKQNHLEKRQYGEQN